MNKINFNLTIHLCNGNERKNSVNKINFNLTIHLCDENVREKFSEQNKL